VATRNQRLAAIHSLAQFISLHCPEHLQWCGEIRAIAMKKGPQPLVCYLEKEEMDALLATPDRNSNQGRRDHAVLLFLYNTGARADEVAHVQVGDLDLGQTPGRDSSSVLIHGKGNKQRRCPLWAKTVNELLSLISGCPQSNNVFINRRGQPLTRFGIYAIVERYTAKATSKRPSMSFSVAASRSSSSSEPVVSRRSFRCSALMRLAASVMRSTGRSARRSNAFLTR
jgi:site-specific recombinase XerD